MPWWKRNKQETTLTTVTVYKDKADKWRWTAKTANGKIVDASEQGYSSKSYATKKATRYAEAFDGTIEIEG